MQNQEDSTWEDLPDDGADEGPVSDSSRGAEWASGWQLLPDVCLQLVFRFLPDRDRCRAALVCHRWRAAVRSPCLWRTRFFRFSGRLSKCKQSDHCLAVSYVRSLGVYLERLEVSVCPPRSQMTAQRLQRAICGLFTELSRVKAPLQALSLERLELSRSFWDLGYRSSVLNSLIKFFRNGPPKLTSVCLTGMQNDMDQALELLSALLRHQRRISPRHCISSLDLRGFLSAFVPMSVDASMSYFLRQLQGLADLGLSYSCLSDQLLMDLQQSHRGSSLQTLSLLCTRNEPRHHLVNGSSWAALVSSCPLLKVCLSLEQVISTDWLANVLVPGIPLREFDMIAFYSPDESWSAKPVLRDMLPLYRRSLQCLTLDLSNFNESLDAELLELVKVCESLVELRVWAFLEIVTVEMLLHTRLTRRTPLSKIKIRIYSVSDSLKEQQDQLEELLSSRLQYLPPDLEFTAAICPFI